MAGIWDRVAAPTDTSDRISSHLLKAAMFLSATGVFSAQQLIDGLNSTIENPLTSEELSELSTIRTSIINAATLADKIGILDRFDSLNIAAEQGVLTNEAVYRAQLGI